MRQCSNCGSKMTLLLTSYVCDTCNPPQLNPCKQIVVPTANSASLIPMLLQDKNTAELIVFREKPDAFDAWLRGYYRKMRYSDYDDYVTEAEAMMDYIEQDTSYLHEKQVRLEDELEKFFARTNLLPYTKWNHGLAEFGAFIDDCVVYAQDNNAECTEEYEYLYTVRRALTQGYLEYFLYGDRRRDRNV